MVECTVPRSQTLYRYLLQWQDLKTQDSTHFKSVNIFCKLYPCIFQWHTLIGNTGNLLKHICGLDSVKTENFSCSVYKLSHSILELPGRKKDMDISEQIKCSWPKRVTHLIASVCYVWFWTYQEGRETSCNAHKMHGCMTRLSQQPLWYKGQTLFQDWLNDQITHHCLSASRCCLCFACVCDFWLWT